MTIYEVAELLRDFVRTNNRPHKVVVLKHIFGAKPGNNRLYKVASKFYAKLIDIGYID